MPRKWRCTRCRGPLLARLPGVERGDSVRCPHCGRFAEFVHEWVGRGQGGEEVAVRDGDAISAYDLVRAVKSDNKVEERRRATGLPGLDYVFNGGLPKSGAILFCGEAGVGKSTLAWEILRALALRKVRTVYVSAEQTTHELGMQFARLGRFPAKNMTILAETDRDSILDGIAQSRAKVGVADSLHAIEGVDAQDGKSLHTGGTNAVAELGRNFKRFASESEIFLFLIGHINTDGEIAGGTRLRHMLDGTLRLRYGAVKDERLLGFEGKNRFGPLGRVARYMHREDGLEDLGPVKEAA